MRSRGCDAEVGLEVGCSGHLVGLEYLDPERRSRELYWKAELKAEDSTKYDSKI